MDNNDASTRHFMVNWLLDESRTFDVFIPRSRTLKHRSQICFPSNEADMIETKA